ncbi:MAG: hypothetical protein HYX26_01815, partial [Acidobacteriales bacterium]|nr:hypothetical protein [Terriglobales bacterium]
MHSSHRMTSVVVLLLACTVCLSAQTRLPRDMQDREALTKVAPATPGETGSVATAEAAASSRVIRYSGVIVDAPAGVSSATVTFSFYADAGSNAPIWSETQAVAVRDGKYSALLGASDAAGLPVELFSNDSARWLGVAVNGAAETGRALLVSVPYAMKALEAERLAGRAGSEFITRKDLQQAVKNALSKTAEKTAAARGQDPTSGGTPAGPTDFTGSNASEVIVVTQNGTGYAINAVASSNIAIRGVSHAAGLAAIQGENDNASGIGLAGVASGLTGLTIGLLGQASSDSGRGLRGVALSTTGPNVGVQGVTNSGDGAAIQGDNLATTGIGLGVRGVSKS